MAEKLTIQSNVRYLIRFLRDDCTPYTGKFGIDYSFYVSATHTDPETGTQVEKNACTMWLPNKEATVLATIGAGKGAVIALLRKESLSEGGKRTFDWSITLQTAPEKPGFEIVEYGTKARVGRLGAPTVTTENPPSSPQEEKPMLPKSRGLDYHQKLYAMCLTSAMEIWREAYQGEEAPAHAIGATASTPYIQMLREALPALDGPPAPKPKVAVDPGDLPF